MTMKTTALPSLRAASAILLFCVASRLAAEAPTQDLSVELERTRAERSIPGLIALVTDEQGVLAEGAAGVRVQGRPDALRVDDLVHIGSVTKPFTATLVAQLVDAGALSWETPLSAALPDLATAMRPAYRGVTVAQLLAHEGGLQPFEDDASPEFAALPALHGDARARRLQVTAYALSLDPVVPPGSAFRYSNASMVVAAAIAERVTNESWEELVRERIFVPLGMASAGIGWPNRRDPNAPWGHEERDGRLVPTPPDDPYRLPDWLAPAGDLSMSLPDLARFARLHLRGFDGASELLRPETFRILHTRRLRGGLGWGVSSLLGHEPVSTFSGSAGTFVVVIALVHDADLGFLVAANAGNEAAEAAVKQELKALVVRFAGDRTPHAP